MYTNICANLQFQIVSCPNAIVFVCSSSDCLLFLENSDRYEILIYYGGGFLTYYNCDNVIATENVNNNENKLFQIKNGNTLLIITLILNEIIYIWDKKYCYLGNLYIFPVEHAHSFEKTFTWDTVNNCNFKLAVNDLEKKSLFSKENIFCCSFITYQCYIIDIYMRFGQNKKTDFFRLSLEKSTESVWRFP